MENLSVLNLPFGSGAAGVRAAHSPITLMRGNPNVIDPSHACTSLYLIKLEDTRIIMFFPMLISLDSEDIIIIKKTCYTQRQDGRLETAWKNHRPQRRHQLPGEHIAQKLWAPGLASVWVAIFKEWNNNNCCYQDCSSHQESLLACKKECEIPPSPSSVWTDIVKPHILYVIIQCLTVNS